MSPDGIRNQIEGGIVQAASWTLYEALKYDTERIRSFDWSSYPILRFGRTAEREGPPDQSPGRAVPRCGRGVDSTAGALANAIFDATGQRMREMPFAGDALRQRIDA